MRIYISLLWCVKKTRLLIILSLAVKLIVISLGCVSIDNFFMNRIVTLSHFLFQTDIINWLVELIGCTILMLYLCHFFLVPTLYSFWITTKHITTQLYTFCIYMLQLTYSLVLALSALFKKRIDHRWNSFFDHLLIKIFVRNTFLVRFYHTIINFILLNFDVNINISYLTWFLFNHHGWNL